MSLYLGTTPIANDGSHNTANVDLSNLSNTGEAHFANPALTNSPYTTNRILEIPQDIKLELNNGTLTLKAGSKAYESDGTVVTVLSDINYYFTGTTANNLILVYDPSINSMGVYVQGDNAISSATAPSTGIADTLWFDTTSNKCKITHDNAATWTEIPLPIGLVSCNSTDGFTSIDQIFNGFGYIGSTVFALPGVKVQAPNGKNEDGTYKSGVITSNSVATRTATGGASDKWIIFNGSNVYLNSKTNEVFDTDSNYWKYDGIKQTNFGCLGSAYFDGTKISSFTPYTVDSVANSNASNFSQAGRSYLSGLGMPSNQAQQLTLLASGQSYTAPSNGWFSVIAAPNPNSYIVLTRSDSAMRSSFHNDGAGAVSAGVFLPVLEGMSVSYIYGGTFYNGANSILFIPAKGEN